jgi:hypothetical protein
MSARRYPQLTAGVVNQYLCEHAHARTATKHPSNRFAPLAPQLQPPAIDSSVCWVQFWGKHTYVCTPYTEQSSLSVFSASSSQFPASISFPLTPHVCAFISCSFTIHIEGITMYHTWTLRTKEMKQPLCRLLNPGPAPGAFFTC